MVGAVVVTHGRLASELVDATQTIIGGEELPQIRAVSIEWDVEVESARARILEAIREVDSGDGVIIMTDMFGGTPSNISLSFLEKDRIEIVTGVNLPMLIKFANLRNSSDLQEAATRVRAQAVKSIHIASELYSS